MRIVRLAASRTWFPESWRGVLRQRLAPNRQAQTLIVLCSIVGVVGPTSSSAQQVLQLDKPIAATLQPYSQMACDAYGTCTQGDLSGTGYKVDLTWQQAMERAGVGPNMRSTYEQSGFSATIYRNDLTKEIVVAYRGTDDNTLPEAYISKMLGTLNSTKGGGATDVQALGWKSAADGLITQYAAARSLASRIKQIYNNTPYQKYSLTLTGHSLGGALASYAAHYVSSNVYTFEPARNRLAGTGSNPNQINLIVAGGSVSDPRAAGGQLAGTVNYLPGRTYSVNLAPLPNIPPAPDLRVRHDAGIVVSLIHDVVGGSDRNTTPSSSRPPLIAVPTQTAAAGPARIISGNVTTPSGAVVNAATGQLVSPPPGKTTTADAISSTPGRTPSAQSSVSSRHVASISRTGQGPELARRPFQASALQPTRPPGGVSLLKAAAEALPIDIEIDGIYYRDGKLVLSGKKTDAKNLDAALVLTGVRAACESGDPYFSLDPDNGAAWFEEGQKATDALWTQVSKDVGWQVPVKADRRIAHERSLLVRTVWARRDYPQLWNRLASEYPDLQSRLVFHPLWLQQTRFGEIMYKADVLLKELASGVSIVKPGSLRAAKVDGYVSQSARQNTDSLFAGIHNENITSEWRGSRFWFDIAPRTPNVSADLHAAKSAMDVQLLATLKEQHLVANSSAPAHPVHQIIKDGDAIDLSSVFPTMFVRRHDITRGVDVQDDDLIMNAFANHINDNIEKYVEHYTELQSLTGVIRAYEAAVHVIKSDGSTCQRIRGVPLFDSEKTAHALPDHNPSELTMNVERYAVGTGQSVNTYFVRSILIQGGVAIAGKLFYASSSTATPTPITQSLNSEIPQELLAGEWRGATGRQFMAFTIDGDEGLAPQFWGQPRQPLPVKAAPGGVPSANSDDYNLCIVLHGLVANSPVYCDDSGKRYYRSGVPAR